MHNITHHCFFCKNNIINDQNMGHRDDGGSCYYSCVNCGRINGFAKYSVEYDYANIMDWQQIIINNYAIINCFSQQRAAIYNNVGKITDKIADVPIIGILNLNENQLIEKIKLILTFQ